jgi:CBS domain-containing protein
MTEKQAIILYAEYRVEFILFFLALASIRFQHFSLPASPLICNSAQRSVCYDCKRYYDLQRIADVMSCEIYPVKEETGVDEIARLLSQSRIKRVPVLHEGKLVGIVCRADIIDAVAEGYVIISNW